MRRSAFDAYLRAFDACDYDAVLAHYAPFAEVRFAGMTLRGAEDIRAFYAFFHTYVRETIIVRRYLASTRFVATEVVVRLEATADLMSEISSGKGYPNLPSFKKGTVLELPQFVHYHLEGGLICEVVCLLEG